jgi:hypothetical protein
MLNAKRIYQLHTYTVERRQAGWFFWDSYGDKSDAKGPYGSETSVTLMIARALKKELLKRDRIHQLAE